MKISQNCIDLIKKWEGYEVPAKPCPAGVPTIGWGTIRYLDGRPVQNGDVITEQQAEGFLIDECQEKAKGVAELVSVPLNQNQFDALVSFCYNIGLGAFKDSTLRRKLNELNYEEAANQFKVWNKATVKEERIVLEGLVNRRKEEESLFRKNSDFGIPIEIEPSLEKSVTWLKGYLDQKNTVVVAYNNDKVVEIVSLNTPLKDDLIDLLRQYPNAKNFHIAPSGSAIPEGNRIEFAGRSQTPSKVENPPKLDRGILLKGMSDEDAPGHDIREIQQRLKDLGYYNRELDGIFGDATDDAVRKFQGNVFGVAEADGKIGPKTWAKLWGEGGEGGEGAKINEEQTDSGTYLRLTKTNRKDRYGCYVLVLEYVKNGTVKGRLEVCSGQPSRQFFRTGPQSVSGSMEPLPEGKWYIHNINWAGGKDKYGPILFSNGLGPVSTPIEYKEPNSTRRSAIEIHIDWNRPFRGNAPGTAGCIGIYDIPDYKTFVTWLRDQDIEPRDLYVNWGLGTCPKPS